MRTFGCECCESRRASYFVMIPLVLIALFVLWNLPELRRYLRIRQM
jgi:hypothetical protein